MNKDKQFISFVLLVGVLIIFSFFVNKKTEAGFAFANPFGGRVTSTQTCTCSEGTQVTIQGPGQSSGTYLYKSSARGYKYRFISPGRNVVGKYSNGGSCKMTGDPCYEVPITKGTITIFGASF